MYRKRRSNLKPIMIILSIILIVLGIFFRDNIRKYIIGNILEELGKREKAYFISEKSVSGDYKNILESSSETEGIMIFTIDNTNLDLESIKEKFKKEEITGTIRRDGMSYDGYGTDKRELDNVIKGTKVNVLSHYKSNWYYVNEIDTDKKLWISEDNLRLSRTPKLKEDVLTSEELEVYANSLGIEPTQSHFIYVDILRQKIYSFKNYSGKWDNDKIIDCIPGEASALTPKGEFKIVVKDELIKTVSNDYMSTNLIKMDNGFDIRSIPTHPEGGQLLEELPRRNKEGNIWVSKDDAQWLYKNLNLDSIIIIN